MSSTDATTAAYISQRIAANTNIQDITPQSKITLITQGILTEKNIFEAYHDETLDNMYIQTASEDYLDLIGVSDGIVRTKEPMLRVSSQDNVVALQRVSGDAQDVVLPVGYTLVIQEGLYWIRLLEEIDLSMAEKKTYLSGDIISYEEVDSISFTSDSSYVFENGDTSYNITFEKSVSIPVLLETIDDYRDRVLYARQSTTTGTASALRLALSSINLISQYTLNFNTNPIEVLIFNQSLIESDADYESLTQYAIPLVETKLNLVSSEASVFAVNLPKKVDFSFKIKEKVSSPRALPSSIYNFVSYLKSKYVLGVPTELSVSTLVEYLNSLDEDTDVLNDYTVEILLNFLGTSYSANSDTLTIEADEYPFFKEVVLE